MSKWEEFLEKLKEKLVMLSLVRETYMKESELSTDNWKRVRVYIDEDEVIAITHDVVDNVYICARDSFVKTGNKEHVLTIVESWIGELMNG